jgi:predicted DCC family thiol-disulfide oxidoreductase YuxK
MNFDLLDRDTIYFDASCGMCQAGVTRFERLLRRRRFTLEPLQSPGVAQMLGLDDGQVPDEIKLKSHDGAILGGADAMVYIARRIWWAWPVWLASKIPGVMMILRRGYRRVARHRHHISTACRI